jgi:uncharacterized protein
LRADVSGMKAAGVAALCCAALALGVLAQGCARSPTAPAGGEAPAQSQTLLARPSPAAESPLPRPEGFVGDFAEVIDARTESALESKLKLLQERAKVTMLVATVQTTGGRDIFEYSLALARGWNAGPPTGEEGGGLLLLLAVKDRKWHLQVGERLRRGDLPDDAAAELGAVMTPPLREGRYGEAVTKYVDGIIRRLAERRGFSTKEDEPIKAREP